MLPSLMDAETYISLSTYRQLFLMYATSRQYHVLLPDGRTQTVKYTVDGQNGYVAELRYR